MIHMKVVSRRRLSVARSAVLLPLLVAVATGCGSAFKEGIRTWAGGPGYKGAVARVHQDQDLEDTERRIELMNLSGLKCTLDQDKGTSTDENPSAACKCSLSSAGGAQQLADCKSWAESFGSS